jgi:excisionase family DNA binding protein
MSELLNSHLNGFQSVGKSDRSQFFEKLVTKKQLAEVLSISESFVNKLMAQDGLPYRQIGRAVRFSVNEVVEWLQSKRRP